MLRAMVASLWPLITGLAVARAGLIASCYGSYTSTDAGLFTDGAMLVGLFVLLIPFLLIAARKTPLEKPWVNRIARICIALESALVAAIGVVNIVAPDSFELKFILSVACTVTASGAMYYWLRRARGSSSAIAAVFVFFALMISEVELYITVYLPTGVDCFVPAVLALVQFPCITWARKRKLPSSIEESSAVPDDFFGFAEDLLKSKQLLITFAIGIVLLSIVTGYLRGYPDGESIPFTFVTRLAYGIVTIGLSAAIVASMIRGKTRATSQAVFICLEVLACIALICYAAFPGTLDVGAVFTTALNALMVAFTWYVVIAFMSYGWRDPYYYAIAGWFVWLGARGLTRVTALAFQSEGGANLLFFAIMATFLVISANVINMQFLRIERSDATSASAAQETHESPLLRLMGIDEGESLADMRQSAIRHSAEVIGAQFLLSEREVDVLALYAQGFTQKKVAEELFITPSTAHAHIKRIYAKTGMHSRQDILDYIETYVS